METACQIRHIAARPLERAVIDFISGIGKHPETIREALECSNRKKGQQLRPFKSRLTRLEQHHRKLSDSVHRCIELTKKKGSGALSREYLAETERLAGEKQEVEAEMEKVRMEIRHCQKVMVDEAVVSAELVRFPETFKRLPSEEQKELLRLLIREIRVNHFDPEKDVLPDGRRFFIKSWGQEAQGAKLSPCVII